MKQCELWNVLQNEDEHRLLESADTKYDALITHIWALNNFAALFSNTVGVPAASRACAGLPATEIPLRHNVNTLLWSSNTWTQV